MKKNLLVLFLVCFSVNCVSQTFPLKTDNYDMELFIDFTKGKLSGKCGILLTNTSDKKIPKIPLLLYRLMSVTAITDTNGNPILFEQQVKQFDDFGKLQVNTINIKDTIQSKQQKQIIIYYEGYLLGYTETGMRYIKDKISPDFTLIRDDAYSYPIIGKPSLSFLRQNSRNRNFTYDIKVTVPDSLVVANGGILESKSTIGNQTTYSYKSKKENWRLDIAIAPYKKTEAGQLDIFYYKDSSAAKNIANIGIRTFALYKEWWGNLKNSNAITIIETENGSGGQTDETTILLPGEAFTDKNNYEYLFHEISHLWNVLIKESMNPPRWEEGLATFSQYLVAEKMNIKDVGYVKRVTDNHIKYMNKNLKSNSKLAQTPFFLFGKEGLTDFSYTQGMIMFSTLYSWLGEETFNNVIRSFYEKFYEKGASTKDFTDLWSKTGKQKNIKVFFEDWMYTTHYADLIEKYDTLDSLVEYYKSNKK